MAVIRLPSKVVFQLLELPHVFCEDERVLIDRGDLLVDPGEGLLRARLFLAELPDQVGPVREPFQFPCDSRHALFESSFVSEGAERGLPIDVGPERGDLAMKLIDPVLGLIASLLVLVLREVELPSRCARGRLALLVVRLRFLQPVPFFPEVIEVFDLFLEGGSFRFEFGGDLTLVSDFCLAGLQGLFEDLETKELLEHRESLRPARGPQLLHLLLADEGRVPESVVIEADHITDRPFFVRDRPLDRLAVPCELEVRFLFRREAAGDLPALVPLAERHADVAVRPADVRELHALDVSPRRLGVQGKRDRVQDRRFPRTRAARDHRVFLRKPERWNRLLEIPHEPAHLDLLEDESLRARRGLQTRDRGGFDLRIVPHERASLSTRRASTLIASRFGWSARTLST